VTILSVHNIYQQRGGEDESTALEVALLRDNGHDVIEYRADNARLADMSAIRAAARTTWSMEAYRDLRALMRRHRPEVMHVQNFFPLISPAAYYAARAERVPVVQSLRNFRLLCPGATLLRKNEICQDCVGRKVPVPAVVHACYRGSRLATAAVAGMLAVHHALGTWTRMVDCYVALTNFSRDLLIEGGLPADKMVVKPNFVAPDPGMRTGVRNGALFVGRLAPEKGLRTLIEAWRHLPGVLLRIAGDGPMRDEIKFLIAEYGLGDRVQMLGYRPVNEVASLLADSRCLVFPSIWYEPFGRAVIEAYASGVPVIASDIGSLRDLVVDGLTGLHFRTGDPLDLAGKVRRLQGNPDLAARMGRNARAEFEAFYSAESNYRQLLAIYERAMGQGSTAAPAARLAGQPIAAFQ
jgi:glycosyltransferase involved in cell wall biosynthesis